jgi:hypothetical protein
VEGPDDAADDEGGDREGPVLADEAEVDATAWTQGTFGFDLRAVLADIDNRHVTVQAAGWRVEDEMPTHHILPVSGRLAGQFDFW